MLLHRRQDTQIALHAACVVVADVAFNHLDQLLLAGKTPAIVAFPFQDAPEALHWAVVNAVGHTGHTLCHPGLLELVVKGSAGVLEPSVAVEQRVSVRVSLNGLVKGLVDKRVIITLTDHIGHDAPVTEVQDGAQVEFVYCSSLIPFEFSHIGQPLLIGLVCPELAVKKILGYVLGVPGLPGTAMAAVLDGGSDIPGPANTQHPLIIDVNAIVVAKIVIESPIALIWTFFMDLLDFVSQLLIFLRPAAQLSRILFVIGRTGHMKPFAGHFF